MTLIQLESAILDVYNVLLEHEEKAGRSLDRPRVTHEVRRETSEKLVSLVVDSLKNP